MGGGKEKDEWQTSYRRSGEKWDQKLKQKLPQIAKKKFNCKTSPP
jgi:hypothetical protein